MKKQLVLGCLAVFGIAAAVAAFGAPPPHNVEGDNDPVPEIAQALRDAVESKQFITLMVEGQQYSGVPLKTSKNTVTIQSNDHGSKILCRLDRISGVILMNSPEEIEAAKSLLQEAYSQRKPVSAENGNAAVKVNGTVTLNGKPLGGVMVAFYDVRQLSRTRFHATTQEDGTYEVHFPRLALCCAWIGEYQVKIMASDPAVVVPDQYQGEEVVLKAEVKAGENVLNFDLTSE